jgi:Mitochondrial carrier protein
MKQRRNRANGAPAMLLQNATSPAELVDLRRWSYNRREARRRNSSVPIIDSFWIAVVIVAILIFLPDVCTATSVAATAASLKIRSKDYTKRIRAVDRRYAQSVGRGGGVLRTVRHRPWLEGLKNGLASALAAACVKTTLQPIDAIKTMQQYAIQTTGQSLTVYQAYQRIVNQRGFWNLYAGLGMYSRQSSFASS